MQSDGQSLRNFRLQKPCDNWPRLITNWSITPKIFPNGFPNQSLFPYFRSSISHSSILSETIFQSFILAGRTPHSLNLKPETSKFAKTKKKTKKEKLHNQNWMNENTQMWYEICLITFWFLKVQMEGLSRI